MDNGKLSGNSFFRILGFGILNAILLYLMLYLTITVMVNTIGFSSKYSLMLNPYFSGEYNGPVSEIVIPDGYSLSMYFDDDDDYIKYWIQDWRGDHVSVLIPKLPCTRDFKTDYWDVFITEPKTLSIIGSGHLKSVYSFNGIEVYVKRMGIAELPNFFGYIYFAYIPDKCTTIEAFESAPNLQAFLSLVDQIAFEGKTEKPEFLKNVKGY